MQKTSKARVTSIRKDPYDGIKIVFRFGESKPCETCVVELSDVSQVAAFEREIGCYNVLELFGREVLGTFNCEKDGKWRLASIKEITGECLWLTPKVIPVC